MKPYFKWWLSMLWIWMRASMLSWLGSLRYYRRARMVWCFFSNHIFHRKVRYTSDFYDPPESEDFMDFQQKWMWDICITNPYKRPQFCCREIPRDFCKKDRNTGVQAAFHCNVCNCDLRCSTFYFSFYRKIWVGSLKYLLWLEGCGRTAQPCHGREACPEGPWLQMPSHGDRKAGD